MILIIMLILLSTTLSNCSQDYGQFMRAIRGGNVETVLECLEVQKLDPNKQYVLFTYVCDEELVHHGQEKVWLNPLQEARAKREKKEREVVHYLQLRNTELNAREVAAQENDLEAYIIHNSNRANYDYQEQAARALRQRYDTIITLLLQHGAHG